MGLRYHSYKYVERLLALEASAISHRPGQPVAGFLPLDKWTPFLRSHPDQRLAAFLHRGIAFGFRIGFNPSQLLRPGGSNHQSVALNPEAVSRYIDVEVSQGKLRPCSPSENPPIHISPIGIVPKSGQLGKFRLIVDLSFPQQASVNDRIDPSLCSLEYSSVDQAVQLVVALGKGALMAKVDLKSAYRMVPVHPQDQWLLGMEWQGSLFCDRALPFGLRSAPIIFTAVADGLAWAISCQGVGNFIHYLDDFLFCGPPASHECARALEVVIPLCSELGMPVAPNKVVGPATALTFLGIEIDSVREEIRLPMVKIRQLQEALDSWKGRKSATKHQLQVLLGRLNHAASVVRSGRIFLRFLIETMKIPNRSWQRVRLSVQCRSDIEWWALFLPRWNGISFFPHALRQGRSMVSDASGNWGCGAFFQGTLDWFQLEWSGAWLGQHIAAKELFPIVVGAAVWGRRWSGSRVLFLSDNQAVVQALSSKLVRDPLLMHLLHCLFFFEAFFKFEHSARHLPGALNTAADALLRDKLDAFQSVFPQAPRSPTAVPPELCLLLSDLSLSWASSRWRILFNQVLQAVC